MSLTFVLGKSQKNHQKEIVDRFLQDYKKNPQDKFYFIVPNHIKFESEISIIKNFKNEFRSKDKYVATNNLQIFSLSRLAWYFLRDTNVLNRQSLTETKKAMIIRSILSKEKDNLPIFKGEIKFNGFIDEIAKQLNEFQDGNISIKDLENIKNETDSSFEKEKIAELQLIYQKYQEVVNENYLQNNYLNDQLLDYFENSSALTNTHFYIYGFSAFKKSEISLINSMIVKSEITMSLELDKPYIELPEKTDFYFRPSRTYKEFYEYARKENIPINNEYASENRVESDLQKLEDFWISSNTSKEEIVDKKISKNSLQIWQATDKQAEIQSVATYIRQLVATQNYRFKDFLVLTRDLSEYESFISPMFKNLDVPIFLDLQHNMSQHPLKLVIDYIFDFARSNLSHESIFQLLKLDLLKPTELDRQYFKSAVDLAENYSLANGLFKSEWLSDEDFNFDVNINNLNKKQREKYKNDFRKINVVKEFVKNIYTQLQVILKKNTSNKEVVTDIYKFLINNNVFGSLKYWQDKNIEDGNIEKGNIPEQVVNTLNNILDEFIDIFGEDKFDINELLSVLDSGFSASQYSQIPSTLDAVNISELGMVQMNNRKVTIILGCTAEQMPKTTLNNSLLSDEEKEKFSKFLTSESKFNDSSQVINNDEPYLHNSSFISSSLRTIFTYPVMASDSKEQLSPYIQRIENHFNIEERIITNSPNPSDEFALEYVGSTSSTLNYLIRLNRELRNNNSVLSEKWKMIQDIVLSDSDLNNKFKKSLNYKNIPVNLEKNVSQKLYGDTLNVSISQLETFYKNEYEYFLKYGLKVLPRNIFELTPANIGSFFHDNLDKFVKYISENKIDIQNLTDEQAHKVSNKIINQVLQSSNYKIFESSNQMKYITNQLSNIINTLIQSIKKQAALLTFEPIKSEITFGSIQGNKGIAGISYDFDGKKINVRGKIDRIDSFNNKNALQIIDYKSSEKKFEYGQFYSGLQLQLTTYIQAILNNYSDTNNVVGAFYSHIYNPIEKAKFIMKKNEKNYQLSGIIVDDSSSIDILTKNGLDEKNSSNIYKLRLNKNGELSSSEKVTKPELEQLLDYNKKLIIFAGEKVFSGEINLNPFRKTDQSNGLQHSDYKSIFEFDAMLPENNYREISTLSKTEFLKKLVKGEDNNGN
ncbi:PD-(D/E)XK nuclease family protein [Companilactobacillus sp. DQM5]|uniref:PD-(D/E)XK nuclease family protein n=1 Tax=Companilactobacillus sp. DQM5 TaxID=3463359 RepID=UPI0040598B92